MKLEVKPEILEVVKRQGVTGRNAGTSRDGQISWIYNAGFLEVVLCETNETLATWRFGKILKDTNTIITCVADLTYGVDHLLVIATNSFTDLGTINIFSLGLRKVIRAIEIPQRVTALDVVFTNTNEDVPEWILSKHLQFFSGLVAVGTETGYIYLVDLCLDELMVNHSTEATPKKLTVVSPAIVDPKAKREQAKLYDRHLAVLLDDQSHKQGHFYYRRQDDNIEKVLDEDTVTVTSIKYLSQAGTLAVGFNFGSFQLWRLYNPVLDYSSRFSSHGVAVSHFVVQEPENDPRNFVYLWVGHDDLTVDSISSVCLYQLSFTKKHIYPGFGMFYEELESVCARLDHKLTLDPYSSDLMTTRCSSIVDCYTIVNPYYTPPSKLSDSFDEGLHTNDLSLSVFVWRAESKRTGGVTKHWMCIFDLNRWYHAQMPHALRCHGSSIQVCSYWVACNLDEVVSLTPATDSLLGVGISGDKVFRFINNSALPPEEHSYPSALQLTDIQFIKSDCTIRAKCDGWQGQLLCQLAHHGAQLLVQPADFYHQCHRARLLPQNYEEMRTNTADYQRAVLLNMALEHGVTSTLVPQCIQQWADGEFAEQGCTLSFLLDWAWNRVVTIKQLWDAACEMLYDWSGHHLDSRTDRQLESLTESLASLKQIFSALVTQSSPTTERGEIEMDLRQDVINILLLHCNAVRWCVSFNLLPETDEASDPLPGMFSYPFNSLHETYTKKRAELSTRKGVVKDFSLLLIDGLIDCQGPHIKQMWKTLGGDGLYPPPNMQAVVNMYLIEEVSAEVKHAVTLYLLQDLAALTKHEASEMVITSFIQRFMLSPGLVHQIQGLWFIDHRDFEEGVRHLVNPNIHEDLGGSWKHVAVINSLLAQSEGKAATRYLHTKGVLGASPQEQQLYISVLLNNRQVSQALDYMRGCQNENNSALLLDHLLNECHKYKLLGHLLQLSLNESEEMHLEQYLRARSEPHALEPLFLYYLHHSRFLQAFQLNEDMKKMDRLETSLVAQERAATRNRLMEAYLKVLPDVACKLLMEKQRGSAVAAKRVEVSRPKPLSTKVHSSDHVAMSRSHFVMAVLEKVTEAENVANEGAHATEDHMTKAVSESRSGIPFLSTPRTPRQKAYSRASEVIYSGLKLSPLATNPLSVVKRNLTMDAKQEQQNGNISLRQLTEECLQLLHTPVRNHKRQSVGSSMAATVSHIKTPQSILKVQRLSKTLLPTPKEKSSAKRFSGPRSLRLASSSECSLQASPTSSPSTETTAASASHLASSENTAVKQLRFAGISPSPTPSPTMKPEFFSSDRSKEMIDTEHTSASWDQDMDSTEVTPQEAVWTPSEQSSAYLSETSVRTPVSERSRPQSSIESLPVTSQAHSSLQELNESYTNEMARGDLHSSWKQGQLLGHSGSAASCPTSSVSITNAPRLSQQEAMEADSMQRGRDCQISTSRTEVVEETTSSHTRGVLTASFSQEVVKTTTRYIPLSVDTELSSSRLQETSVHASRSDSKRNLSPLLISSGHNQRFRKSSSMSPRSVQTSVIASQAITNKSSGGNLSPPITPPSSKKARILESRAKELGLSRKSILFASSPDKSETDEPMRRKTPPRRSPSRQTDYEELPRKTPTRRSPSQQADYEELPKKSPTRRSPSRQSDYEELPRKSSTQRSPSRLSDYEELPRKTPTRRSPSRQSDYEELPRKTLERRSPSRRTKQSTEHTVNIELQRETLEIKPTSPKLEGRIDEDVQRKTLERTSPLRKMQKLDYGELDMPGKITERKSPARKLQIQEETKFDVDKDVSHSKRSLRRTPDRQSVARKTMVISESDDDRPIRESEDTFVYTYKNHKKHASETADADDEIKEDVFREAEDVLGKLSAADASPEVPERRRSARLKTPDRATMEGLNLEPLTTAKGHGRLQRTPQRESQKQANDNKLVEIEEKPSPSRRSTRKRVLSETIEENKLELVTSGAKQTVESVTEQTVEIVTSPGKRSSADNKEEKEETEVLSVRRSTRQSKTPDRLVAKDNALEPLTPTRKSRRLLKTAAEEPESVKTSAKSPVKMSQEGAPFMGQELPAEKSESLKVPSAPADRPKTRSRTPEHVSAEGVEPVILSVSSRRSTKMKVIKESEEADLTSHEGEKDQTKEKSLRSRKITPERHVQDTSSEEPKHDADDPIIGTAKSPGRSRQSPARQTKSPGSQTKSPARQTKSPARETKSPAREAKSPARETKSPARERKSPARQTRSRADDVKTSELKEDYGWSEEMPTLRLEVDDDVDSEKDGIHAKTDTTKIKAIEIHRGTSLQKQDATTSEDPLLPSTPARLTRAGKSNHEQALMKSVTPAFVFSPPLKHSEHDEDNNHHPSSAAAAADEEKPLFVFSHPTVAEDTGASVETDAAEVEPESKEKPQEETKQKRRRKRTLMSYSPILLSPYISPVSSKKSQKHRLDTVRLASGRKPRAPPTRRIKPSTWTKPTTSRQ
ncbi:hypothetical protein BsWGS_26653 [Bradybaena similaris]